MYVAAPVTCHLYTSVAHVHTRAMSHHTKYSLRSCFSIAISAATAGRLNLLLEVPADWNYYSMWQISYSSHCLHKQHKPINWYCMMIHVVHVHDKEKTAAHDIWKKKLLLNSIPNNKVCGTFGCDQFSFKHLRFWPTFNKILKHLPDKRLSWTHLPTNSLTWWILIVSNVEILIIQV